MKKGSIFLIPTILSENTAEKVIAPQVKEVISGLKHYLAENVRTARRFISSLKLGLNIEEISIEVLDKDTPFSKIRELIHPVFEGQDIGIISEAGYPAIADPGSFAVKFAHENEIRVIPLAGTSSFVLALAASGLTGQSFTFHGYLPIEKQKRQQAILEMEKCSFKNRQTQIFMETPYRNLQLLKEVSETCSPETLITVAADLTGPNEYIKTQTATKWKREQPDIQKIPAVFLMMKT